MRLGFHKQTRAGVAALAFAIKDSGDGALHRAIQIRVSKYDVGRFTAQLQRHSLQIVGGGTHDFFAHRGRAGEGDLVYAFMLYQRLPGLRAAGNDIQHAWGQSCLLRQFAETQRRERRLLRGLQYESAAAGQRRPQLPGGQQQRKIPRNDSGHHADGLAQRVGKSVVKSIDGLAVDLGRPSAVVTQHVGRHGHIHVSRFVDDLAVVQRLQLSQLVNVFFDELRQLPQNAPALARRHLAPRPLQIIKRFAGRLHRRIHVLRRGRRNLG